MYTKEVAVVDDLAVSLALAFAGDVPDGTPKTGKRVLTRRDTVLNSWVTSTKN